VTPLTTSTPSSRQADPGAEGAAALAERLGHTFADLSLLQHALAHRSWCGEQEGGAPSNERLEFLGDAVLGLVVARFAYERYPEFAEGKLAKVRSAVVNARVLAQVAARLGVGDVLLLGRGEEGSGGRTKAVRDGEGPPRYVVVGSGPDHDRAYVAEVYLGGTRWGTGEGRSKKDAEQEAARAAWEELTGA